MPDVTLTHRTAITVDPGSAWDRLQDPAMWATVAGVDSTSDHYHTGDGQLEGFRFSTKISGIPYRGKAEVTAAEPGRSIALSIRSNELTGTITVSLEGDGAPVLAVTMTMRPNGLLGGVVFPLVTRSVRDGFGDSVDRLAQELS